MDGIYQHTNGGEYTIVMLTNEKSTSDKYPPMVVYKTIANGNVWSRPINDWDRSFTLTATICNARPQGLVCGERISLGETCDCNSRLIY